MHPPETPCYTLRLYRVQSEDPWRTELLEERRFSNWEEAREEEGEVLVVYRFRKKRQEKERG